ncbi:SANT/Myb domain-containing protein [Cinnamomum micranthum f. kanehirae]|uniref:SANT/Myb domain-containing protein n=1 Tax=Cinnamomum micranthum f. kanehirae TaxID=337451 RepID=A0A3S4N8X2_9MAGN|nr:SANT/Myb domain-containing protein [Cinnamomum micranthum f. kanehirae]
MFETKKKKRKVFIREDDIPMTLRRYSATTLLTLLQEVAQFPGVKIDWNLLVKKTSTGISNAREYQMVWRHLAYRDILLEKLEEGDEPFDDDSDLEVELEPSPAVNGEAMTEAAACVKKQPLPSVPSLEGLEGNGSASGNLQQRKRRKRWTPEEDMELIAAVQKCGEGNWANILKGDFKHDRSASQLSQRWSIIRKNKANLTTSIVSNSTGGALTEAQLAARQAVSMALNMPMKGSLLATSSVGQDAFFYSPNFIYHLGVHSVAAAANLSSTNGNSSTAPAAASDASLLYTPLSEVSTKAPVTSSPQILQQCQQAPSQTPLPKVASSSNPAPPKPRPTSKRLSAPAKNLPTGPNPLIQAAAVAAGARIATPSTAASLFKAAQSRNAVHIRQGGSVPQSSMPVTQTIGHQHHDIPAT